MLGLVIVYAIVFAFLPPLSTQSILALHFTHALLWRLYHTFVLGMLLRAQSKSKFLVRHFLKHYHYSDSSLESGRGAVQEAFTNWKAIYNLSMCMTYGMHFAVLIRPNTMFTDCSNSIVPGLCLENLSVSARMDRWQSTPSSHPRRRKLCDIPASANDS